MATDEKRKRTKYIKIIFLIITVAIIAIVVISQKNIDNRKSFNLNKNLFINDMLVVKEGKNYGVINKDGEYILDCKYDYLELYENEELIRVINDGITEFYVDATGKTVIGPDYDYLGRIKEGYVYAKKHDKYGFFDKTGQCVIEFKYNDAESFSDGVTVVETEEGYSLIDIEENVLTDKYYDYIEYIYYYVDDSTKDTRDYLEVYMDEKHGYIDKTGKEVVEPKYDKVNFLSDELIAVCNGSQWGFVDKKGKELTEIKYDNVLSFSESLVAVCLDNKWGFVNESGKEVIKPKYEDVGLFSEGLVNAQNNGKYGYINDKGKEVIPFQYDRALGFEEGLARVQIDDKEGLIDINGKFVVGVIQYDYIGKIDDGNKLILVEKDGKYGYINKKGKEIIPLQYENAGDFENGMAAVKIDEKYGYINEKGKLGIHNDYYYAFEFADDGYAVVGLKNKKFAIIDKYGNKLGDKEFDSISDMDYRFCEEEDCYDMTNKSYCDVHNQEHLPYCRIDGCINKVISFEDIHCEKHLYVED